MLNVVDELYNLITTQDLQSVEGLTKIIRDNNFPLVEEKMKDN